MCFSRGPSARKNRPVVPVLAFSIAVAAALTAPNTTLAQQNLEYNRDIRPILAENCFACHGPDSASRKADLRLDRREAAVEKGAIVPGEVESSELLARIMSESPEERMPPPVSTKNLTAEQKETLKRWIEQGAEYQPHWSFIPPTSTGPPEVKNPSWGRNPIDRFILARLEAAGLETAPEADRATLIRRLSLDLRGLPPTPAEVEAFVGDERPDAYERLLETFMASPYWGEHRGRYWLDAARYADTHGYHFDNFREMWTYRDWVIDAFNRNLPFDRFTIEQLAGDLLPNRTIETQIASGFNRCNMTTNEGGVIPEEYLVLYTRDRTEAVANVWMGLTAQCAVCHDHKFDPLSQREFYELAAFFNNTAQGAMDGNIKDTPPIVIVPRDEERSRWETLGKELAGTRTDQEKRTKEARPEFDSWLAKSTPETLSAKIPSESLKLRAALEPRTLEGQSASTGVALPGPAFEDTAAGDFDTDQVFSISIWVKLAKSSTGAIVGRMTEENEFRGWDLWIEGNRVGMHLVHHWPDDALKVLATNPIPENQWTHLTVTYDGQAKDSSVRVYYDGKLQPTQALQAGLKSTIRTTVPLKLGQRHTSAKVDGLSAHDLRIYTRLLEPEAVDALAGFTRAAELASLPADKRPESERNAAFDWWIGSQDPTSRDLRTRIAALETEEAGIKQRGTIAHVMQEKAEMASAFILFRGDYDKRRDEVKADTPGALPDLPSDLPRNRLGLAQWLLRPEHPLTARVTVNRAWQELFGQGIVRTAGDFGTTGELPSHQELLDWLALEFQRSGWDLKWLYRTLLSSSTYRQSAATTKLKLEKDAANRLLSRGPRFRMDAEMIRDYALATGGLLQSKFGGPSVKPYQPEGIWEAVAMPESNTRIYRQDSGESLYRRSLYTFWKRAAPPASMEIFNAPNRESCTVRRERTDTPLQALVTLNDPQFVEAAKQLAASIVSASPPCFDCAVDDLALRVLARTFKPEERSVVEASFQSLLAHFQAHTDDAAKLLAVGESKIAPESGDPATIAAWTMLANEILNLDEVLNK